jgi:hypothetical protein
VAVPSEPVAVDCRCLDLPVGGDRLRAAGPIAGAGLPGGGPAWSVVGYDLSDRFSDIALAASADEVRPQGTILFHGSTPLPVV